MVFVSEKIGCFYYTFRCFCCRYFYSMASGRACAQTSIEHRSNDFERFLIVSNHSTAKVVAKAFSPPRTRNLSVTLSVVFSKSRAHSLCPVITQFNPRGSHEQIVYKLSRPSSLFKKRVLALGLIRSFEVKASINISIFFFSSGTADTVIL